MIVSMFMDKATFEQKQKEKKFSLSYVKWSKEENKYINLEEGEKEGLEVILLNNSLKRKEILEFVKSSIYQWKVPAIIEIEDLTEDSFKDYFIFIYGRNLDSNNKNKELFSLSILEKKDKDTGYLHLNVAYPKSQRLREERTDGIIGAVGSNTRHAMISYAFNYLKYTKVTTDVISPKALLSLQELGFVTGL